MYRWYWMPATTTLQDNKFFLFNEICQILLGDFSTWFISIDWCKKGSLILHCKTFYNHQKINHMKKVLLFIYLLFNYIITFSQQIGQISFSKNPLNKGQIGNEKKFKSGDAIYATALFPKTLKDYFINRPPAKKFELTVFIYISG